MIAVQSSRNDIPSWALARLQQEVQGNQFLPSVGAIHTWLQTLGIKVCKTKASEARSWMGILIKDNTTAPSAKLLMEPNIHALYQQWKQEHAIESDAEALTRLISDFLGSEISQQVSDIPDDTKPDRVLSISDIPVFLKQTDLAKRLGVTDTMLKNNRNKEKFPRWTKLKDPDKVGWIWVRTLRKYRSLL
ncbi:hypothetical protein [Leptolyngbya sp. FACHB-671]|uniref:hypothetical protein n=1 Tax=Leptolyngbya sp. FACHB-671 TaxID=2692812 RepID=UPI001F54E62E|nr:hypothetical protein [Leptolyngbya sp. FACHB-671]